MFKCEICNKEYDNGLAYGGHVSSHKRIGKRYPRGDKPSRPTPFTNRTCLKCGGTFFSLEMGGHVSWCSRPQKTFEEMSVHGKRNVLILEKNGCCWECGISNWNNKPITLELDHINGDPDDNSKENLRILCPNCHSQTPTYKNKNRNRRVASIRHEKQKVSMKKVRDKRKTIISLNGENTCLISES